MKKNNQKLVAKWKQMQKENKRLQRFNNAAAIICGYLGATLSFLSIAVAYEYAPTFFGVSMFLPITAILIGCGIFCISIPIEEANSSLR